jgi:hypothetical protein
VHSRPAIACGDDVVSADLWLEQITLGGDQVPKGAIRPVDE